MPFGLGSSKEDKKDSPEDAQPEATPGQTTDNNVDPARNPVNPQRLTRDQFTLNSMLYGMPIPTGCTSTWDRRLTPETRAFHSAVMKHYARNRGDVDDDDSRTLGKEITHGKHRGKQKPERRRAVPGVESDDEDEDDAAFGTRRYDDVLPQTSVNNFLMGEFAGTGEGTKQSKLGRQRGTDVEEPAHHFQFHKPTVNDRVQGTMKAVEGTIRMDQDIQTRARAVFHGQTIDGH